jgi:hypothetical protein
MSSSHVISHVEGSFFAWHKAITFFFVPLLTRGVIFFWMTHFSCSLFMRGLEKTAGMENHDDEKDCKGEACFCKNSPLSDGWTIVL